MKRCADCKYSGTKIKEIPCIICYTTNGFSQWEPKEMEQDYSFNQSIIDALKDGKSVWYNNNISNWVTITLETMHFADSRNIIKGKWSLTKPKVKVKKKLGKWANVYISEHVYCFESKEDAIKAAGNKELFKAIAVPFTIEYEVEE